MHKAFRTGVSYVGIIIFEIIVIIIIVSCGCFVPEVTMSSSLKIISESQSSFMTCRESRSKKTEFSFLCVCMGCTHA